MAEYFEGKAKYLRQMDNGLIKAVTEHYLIDALSFTEAESRLIQEVGANNREVTVVALKRSNIREVAEFDEAVAYHRAKVIYTMTGEDGEREKKVTTYLLVRADDVREAEERTKHHLREMLIPYEIIEVRLSPIIEVMNYAASAPRTKVGFTMPTTKS